MPPLAPSTTTFFLTFFLALFFLPFFFSFQPTHAHRWGVVVASVLMFVALAVNVFPSYSICVHLGLDHKAYLLPSDEHREHFRLVAEERKREEEEKERDREASSKANERKRQLQKMVSRRLPRQSDLSASRSVSSEHHH